MSRHWRGSVRDLVRGHFGADDGVGPVGIKPATLTWQGVGIRASNVAQSVYVSPSVSSSGKCCRIRPVVTRVTSGR